jgi:hypothetical protein
MILAISLAILGAYYTALGTVTLFDLSDVTTRWIALSGDADFRFDFQFFMLCIGIGALAVSLFGIATTTCGVGTAAGRPRAFRYWIVLAIAAPLIHFPWFLYRVISTGTLPRSEAALITRADAVRFLVICAAYVLAAILTRRQPVSQTARKNRSHVFAGCLM